MTTRRETGAHAGKDWLVLLGLLAFCFAVAGIAGRVTATSVATWYPTLAKPWFTPPDWLFPPVWSVLYAMMALAAWLVWRRAGWRSPALGLFFVQLAFNLVWSVLFFGLQLIGAAFAEILLLLSLIAAATWAFWRIDRRAGLLLVPYLLWVGYASLLNGAIWLLN